MIRKVKFLEGMTASILSGHREIPPYGMAGGDPGKIGHNYVLRTDGSTLELRGTDSTEVEANDITRATSFTLRPSVAAATARLRPAKFLLLSSPPFFE